jgi:hypothetical protein
MAASAPRLSALISILGDYSRVQRPACRLLEGLAALPTLPLEAIVLVNGDAWRRALPSALLTVCGATIKVISCDEELPAVLFNEGGQLATGDFITFAWPGIDVDGWLASIVQLRELVSADSEVEFLAGPPACEAPLVAELQSWIPPDPSAVPPGFQGGWLEMLDYAPMDCALVSRRFFLNQGGFSCCPLLQRGFWWEFTIRASRSSSINLCPVPRRPKLWSWWNFPLNRDLVLSGDLVARRALRRSEMPVAVATSADYRSVESFAKDLSVGARRRLRRVFEPWLPAGVACPMPRDSPPQVTEIRGANQPLRIVLLGGLNEPAHNQLCFYNYFTLLEGQGLLTWRVILDSAAYVSDLDKADLVIFSRTRTEHSCRMMDYCLSHGIPTVYMLDDNWLSVGREWPEYARIFSPGSPSYECFMYCLVRADRVLTYNPVLAEDLRPYNSQLEEMQTNIDLTQFHRPAGPARNRPLVGYAGSIRRENSAFEALLDLARKRDDFGVFVMSPSIPEALRSLPANRLLYKPYVFAYRHYAQVLCEAQPDILLAPLSGTRTDASKCPNKYLEITAAGAVGIYSNTAPYNRFIRNGDNGLLVDNDIDKWKSAIAGLLDHPQLRQSILVAADRDVRTRFSTPAVLPQFLAFLRRATANSLGRNTKCEG